MVFVITVIIIAVVDAIVCTFANTSLMGSFFTSVPERYVFVFYKLNLTITGNFVNFVSSCVGIMGGHGLNLATSRGLVLRFLITTTFLTILTVTNCNAAAAVPFINGISLKFFCCVVTTITVINVMGSMGLASNVSNLSNSMAFFTYITFVLVTYMGDCLNVATVDTTSTNTYLKFLI